MGNCNMFMAAEPLPTTRMIKVTERRAKRDFPHFLSDNAQQYASAKTITMIMDNLNTHHPGALYETFEPDQVKAFWDRIQTKVD